MKKEKKLLTLKEAVIFTNHMEENIRLQIERGLLNKYDKFGKKLENPLREKGFFKLSELLNVYNIKEDPNKIKQHFFERKKRKDSVSGIIPKEIIILTSRELHLLNEIKPNSIDTWILAPSFLPVERETPVRYMEILQSLKGSNIQSSLSRSQYLLKSKGNVLIHSIPKYLPYYGIELEKNGLFFKYWIVYAPEKQNHYLNQKNYIQESIGILYYIKSKRNFHINRVRVPYRDCSFCENPLKDYGGKKHLRHQDGMVVSDIWRIDFNPRILNPPHIIPKQVFSRMIDLSCSPESTLLLAPYDGEIPDELL